MKDTERKLKDGWWGGEREFMSEGYSFDCEILVTWKIIAGCKREEYGGGGRGWKVLKF